MARFSKAKLIEQLYSMNKNIKEGFDNSNGWAQLRPQVGSDKRTDELIERAVEYGRWCAIQSLIQELENGKI
ncbi:MAG: hypothetical protein RBR08_14545 [Desulforegulaceae bacterium]|nr:hypothetical protein [Desulforegulaceae bacterium]